MGSQKNVLETILGSTRSVFNIQSLRMLTESADSQKLSKSLHYYVKEGNIRNPRRGIYTKATYDEREMACCLFRPAYISLEYVLQRSGVVFQYDDAITCVSYLNRTVEIDGREYQFRTINPGLWIGMDGIERHDNILIEGVIENKITDFNNLRIERWIVLVLFRARFSESVVILPIISYLCNGGKFYGRKKGRK